MELLLEKRIDTAQKIDLRDMTLPELESFFVEIGEKPFRARQIIRWIWQKDFHSFDQITDIPKTLRKFLDDHAITSNIDLIGSQVSNDGTTKFAFRLNDGNIIESVLIPDKNRLTACLSTQVGCPLACAFCLTGKSGFKRNLKVAEIVLQLLNIIKYANLTDKPRNIVFMGMGEPLLNLENLLKAISILLSQFAFGYAQKHITVSTAGIVPKMRELGERSGVGLAVSLHATDNQTRSMLMPINKVYPLEMLIDACRNYPLPKGRLITIEYILIKGLNDSVEHAIKLAKILKGVKAKVNLIPLNENEHMPFKRPDDRAIEKFQDTLFEQGITALIRKSKGKDIMAACGQLAGNLNCYL